MKNMSIVQNTQKFGGGGERIVLMTKWVRLFVNT